MSDSGMGLEGMVKRYQNSYYNGNAEISDAKFDELWDRLKGEDPDNDIFKTVGRDASSAFSKSPHIMNMNSQEKVNNKEDFFSWYKKRKIEKYIVEHKLDGISLELQYEDGKFVRGVTRGDGSVGDDISANVKLMKNFVPEIGENFTGGIRAEIVLFKEDFKEYFEPQGYKNPRNMASGLAKQKRGEGCEHLNIIVYDAGGGNSKFYTEETKLFWLMGQGFKLVPFHAFDSPDKVIKYREEIISERDDLDYDIDGLVIKNNEINLEDAKRARPEYQIAFKFDAVEETTILEEVVWNISGNIVTPIAWLTPVVLNGTTVKKASLVNPDEIRRLGIRIGDEVVITKRGEIIPKIERVYKSNEGPVIGIPVKLIIDDKAWETEDLGVKLVVKGDDFPLIKFHRLEKWVSKMDVKGMGPSLLSSLFKDGWVTEIADFYTIDLDEYLKATNLKRAAEKAFASLYEKSKETTLSKFIGGFDIEGVGEGVIDFVVEAGIDTIDLIRMQLVSGLSEIEGIGPDRAERIFNGLINHTNEMDAVLNTGKVSIEKKKEKAVGDLGLKGLTFCFTGALETMTRDEAFEMVTSKGGSIKSSMSNNVSYLITNTPDSGSAKNKKAEEIGALILTERDFLKMMATR